MSATRRMSSDEHWRRVQSGRYDCIHSSNGYCDSALYADWERERATDAAVAAAHRQQADQLEALIVPGTVLPEPRTLRMVATRLRARADELVPPTRED